jgi:NAD+ synthase (glutamine-hydrolysing)
MKHQFVRAAAASPELRIADPAFNAKKIIETIGEQAKAGVEILVFPELSLCGYTCGDLLLQPALTEGCLSALFEVAAATKDRKMIVFVGLPVSFRGKLYNCAACAADGKVAGIVPKTHISDYGACSESRYFSPAPEGSFTIALREGVTAPFSANLLFRDAQYPEIAVSAQFGGDSVVNSAISVCLNASEERAGKRDFRKRQLSAQSEARVCACIAAEAGSCESTTDCVFSGNHLIYENGICLAEAQPFSNEIALAEIDAGALLYERKRGKIAVQAETYCEAVCSFIGDGELRLRKVPRLPFVPDDAENPASRAEEILSVQSHALARRLAHTGAKTAVIGVSGGLDSALALLVTARAFDLLGKPRSGIVAVTMPGFGTTRKTKDNSLVLMREIGATYRTVRISKTVVRHFKDIGHPLEARDVTYENAQARYRTMILMDIANQTGGLVVGTGDLSELALGWCTYNGDHMSMYAVNAGVPKTLVKYLVAREGERLGGKLGKALAAVVNTEISPELLPPDSSGNIAQKTEDLVGSYELHDFFLYRILHCGDSPRKVYDLARYAFSGDREDEIKKWLVSFYRRFFSQQFKRSCMPDGVKACCISLSPRTDWCMPSDASCALWLREAENL